MKKFLITTIVISLASICWSARYQPFMYRAYLPYPITYVDRLKTLDGWTTEPGIGLNCSGFVSNAREASFRTAADIYQNKLQDLVLVAETINKDGISEQVLQPGDLASFAGPIGNAQTGVHVAAYLGNHEWVDADGRRGYVAKFKMLDKQPNDVYFIGRVRLYRWKNPKFAFPSTTIGRDDRQ